MELDEVIYKNYKVFRFYKSIRISNAYQLSNFTMLLL